MEISGLSSSVQGIQKAFEANAARGKRIQNPETNPQLEKDMAELATDPANVKMQTQVIKTQDKMLGELLDLTA
jgi:hypothetical protein